MKLFSPPYNFRSPINFVSCPFKSNIKSSRSQAKIEGMVPCIDVNFSYGPTDF